MFKPRRSILAVALASSAALMLLPVAGQAAGPTQTLRFFDKAVSITLTRADGAVVKRPPYPEAQPGDVLEVNSLDYRGNHAHHARHFTGSSHLRCIFGTGAPSCESHFAIGGSMLVFTGSPGTVTDGTGIYQDATGRVVSAREIPNTDNTDIVAKLHLR
jgi:hypothetical protein